MSMGSSFHAVNPTAAVSWNPTNTASGNYLENDKQTEGLAQGRRDFELSAATSPSPSSPAPRRC